MEPNTDHHEGLRKRIKQAGLSDVYVIVPVGAENLGTKWVQKEEVDSIITVCAPSPFVYRSANGIQSVPLFETSPFNCGHRH